MSSPMLRPRMLSAAIVATVLAVGASLAFRGMDRKSQDAAGVQLSTKSASRATQDEEKRGRQEREIDEDLIHPWLEAKAGSLVSKDTAERFLKKNGRSANNLYAVWYLTKDFTYLNLLKEQENDPIAMAILAPTDLSFARRARELDPTNAWAILIEARALSERNRDHAAATEAFLRAAKADGYRNYNDLMEGTCRDALLMDGHSFRDAWRISRQCSPQENDPFAAGLLDHLSERITHEPRSAEEQSIDQAMRQILTIPEAYTDEKLVEELFRLKQLKTSTERDLIVVQGGRRLENADFELALEFADDAQVDEAQRQYESDGMEAARRYLIDSVGRERIEQRRNQLLQDQPERTIPELRFEEP